MSEAAVFSWCVVRLGTDLLAFEVGIVGEVLPAAPVTILPRCPAGVLGLISRRGQPLAVVDSRRLFDLPPVAMGSSPLLVLRTAVTLAALPIDACAGVLAGDPATYRPAARTAGEPPWVAGFQPLPGLGIATVVGTADLLRRLDRLRFATAA